MKLRMALACAMACGVLAACGDADEADQAGAAPVQTADAGPLPPPQGPSLLPAQRIDPQAGEMLANAIIAEMNAIGAVVATVTDQASAEAAAQAIHESGARIATAADAAGIDPNDPAILQIFAPHQQEFMEAQMGIVEAATALQSAHPELVPPVADAMASLPGNQ